MDINVYMKEFCVITRHIKKSEIGFIRGKFLYISKDELKVFLDKNAYERADDKLRFWRDMRWIEADEGHLTSRVCFAGQYARMVKIDLLVCKKIAINLPKEAAKQAKTV
jgi:hypothetical protein